MLQVVRIKIEVDVATYTWKAHVPPKVRIFFGVWQETLSQLTVTRKRGIS
jgi:hypothetical protein